MKKKTKSIKLSKFVFIGIIALVIIIGGFTAVHSFRKRINDRTVKVAFYGLSDDIVNLLKEYIPQKEKITIKYDVIAPGAMDLSILQKKYDVLFTWKGEVTDSLAGSVETIPNRLLDSIPSALRNKYCLPLLLDHYEMDVYNPVVSKSEVKPFESYKSFMDYVYGANKLVFSPFFTNGGDDRVLFAFLAVLIEAQGGTDAYNKLIEALKSAQSLSDVLDVELAVLPDDGGTLTLRSQLDILKTWPELGLTHPQWYMGNINDLVGFASQFQVAAFFTSLSQHRTLNYNVVRNFETIRMPYLTDTISHGVIAPAISGVLVSDNVNGKDILASLISIDVQNHIAMKTMLAPVNSRAEAYDVQSDDVRFFAASCAGGALPDPYLAVYQRRPDDFAEMAKEIRAYLR